MSNEITTIDQDLLAKLRENTPVEEGYTRVRLPKLGCYSQDQTIETKDEKGKKKIEVVAEAGIFYTEEKVGEEYVKTEIGTNILMRVVYTRKKLSHYDANTKIFISSSLYDSDNDEVTLFKAGKVYLRGIASELRNLPEFQEIDKEGKPKSKLEVNRVLYVLYDGKPHEMTLRGSSMYSFSTFSKSVSLVTAIEVAVTSEAKEKGSIHWNQLVFTRTRDLNNEEIMETIAMQEEIKEAIQAEKEFFSKQTPVAIPIRADEESIEDVMKSLGAAPKDF